MKAVIVNVVPRPVGGGAELLVREMHRELCERGVQSRVIYFDAAESKLLEGEETLGISARDPRAILRLRARVSELKRHHSNVVIHAHLTWGLFYVALATVFMGCRCVYTEHNTTNKRRRLPFFRFVERFFYRRYERVICISRGVYESLAPWVGKRLRERLVIINNGSRIFEFKPRDPLFGRKPALISIGSLTPKKNFRTAIAAVLRIRDQIHSYTVVGEGPERSKLEQLVKDARAEGLISLLGWSNDIERLLQQHDLQLIPSLWEGFGLVAVEGMSTGISIVASDVAGLREVLDPANSSVNLVSDIQNIDAWAGAISAAIIKLENEEGGGSSRCAREQSLKFSLEAMAEGYLRVYKEVVAEST